MNIYIKVKLVYEAIHSWPECSIKEVDYLKHSHRHQFYISCIKEVSHTDRDVEIIMFKNQIINWLNKTYKHDLGSMSCESLAKEILNKFNCKAVEVLEDNENGGGAIL